MSGWLPYSEEKVKNEMRMRVHLFGHVWLRVCEWDRGRKKKEIFLLCALLILNLLLRYVIYWL